MCLLRHVFPNDTAFPWQNTSPPSPVFTYPQGERTGKQDSKPKVEGWVGLENSQEQTTDKIIPSDTTRGLMESYDFSVQRLILLYENIVESWFQPVLS